MSPITDPTEEYFKDGLWGWVTNQWRKLVADAAGHLQVDVLTSGLPTGGATATNQTTMITALQLIDDLRNALNSIATDELDIVFDGQTLDVEITQTTPADLTPGIEGWDGAAWRKLPLLFGYSSQYLEREYTANAAGGAVTLNFSTVPAGEIWIVTNLSFYSVANTTTRVEISIYDGGLHHYITKQAYPTAYLSIDIQGHFILEEGDNIRMRALSTGAGDDLFCFASGYKMKVAE